MTDEVLQLYIDVARAATRYLNAKLGVDSAKDFAEECYKDLVRAETKLRSFK